MERMVGRQAAAMQELYGFQGQPVRVSFFDPTDGERLGRVVGVLAAIRSDELDVECAEVPARVPENARVTLELTRGGRFLCCHTTLKGRGPEPWRLLLGWPQEVQTVQRRAHPRVDVRAPVHYVPEGSRGPVRGMIVDISAGGAALEGAVHVHPGQVITLVFDLGSGLFFQDIRGEVVRTTRTRSGQWRMGLRFTGMTDEQARLLSDWVRRHDRNAARPDR